MSQLDPTLGPALDLSLEAAPKRVSRRFRIPGWVALLLANPKARLGAAMVGFVVFIAAIAPLISVDDPNAFNLAAPGEAPSWNHLFGTTDQGSDIFSQVVVGARSSLLLGFLAAVLATAVAAALGITAALVGGLFDDIVNVLINVFLVIPPIPLLVVMSGYAEETWDGDDGHRPGGRPLGVRGADPAGAGVVAQEPRLHRRRQDLRGVDVANRLRRARAEHDQPDRSSVRARLLHRAPRRRRARVPRLRRHVEDELGRDPLLGADELDRAAGPVVAVLLPRRRARVHGPRPRAAARRHRRVHQPASADGAQAAPPAAEACSSAGVRWRGGRA